MLKNKRLFLVVLLFLLLGAVMVVKATKEATNEQVAEGDALKAKLITPTLWARSPDMFACNLTNVSETTRTVHVRIISDGNILLDSGSVTVAPLHTANYTSHGFANGGPIYCEFTVEGPKEWYRGAAKLFPPPNGTDLVAIAAQ